MLTANTPSTEIESEIDIELTSTPKTDRAMTVDTEVKVYHQSAKPLQKRESS